MEGPDLRHHLLRRHRRPLRLQPHRQPPPLPLSRPPRLPLPHHPCLRRPLHRRHRRPLHQPLVPSLHPLLPLPPPDPRLLPRRRLRLPLRRLQTLRRRLPPHLPPPPRLRRHLRQLPPRPGAPPPRRLRRRSRRPPLPRLLPPILPPNADLTNVFLSGDSAGANIVHHAAKWFSSNAHLLKTLKIKGTVSIQPFFGGVDRTASEVRLEGAPIVNIKRVEWMWEAFLPVGSDRDHPASNVFGPRSESDGFDWGTFPPTVVIIGGFDPLQDRQREYYEGLKKRGVDVRVVEYPNAIHAFYVFPELPESGVFIDMVGRFIEEKSGGVK
ncbi:putative carboxylesterase 18 [Acorus calamus]|uniref:Carboxylesterase 18 n=1 Tax=Acorus calamus TaxID=4465 RepID=A0AAV9CEL9_ACOCL|nr:putative carboxylesterase 18 [Acorus calamus]